VVIGATARPGVKERQNGMQNEYFKERKIIFCAQEV
jgi:hypothetical protein